MRVQLNNVGVIKHCDVEFTNGINLIVGSSGSGKSTLMRSIYSVASNDFSDSDISFGKNTMLIEVDYDKNHIKYGRSVKPRGEKCYYDVNGEMFVKLGRQPLPQVADILKIGDVDINGEKVNFNFNLQFSSPFLILGSQSTLYNVLTYRSSFDISSINNYYATDLKSNSSDISTNIKLKEKLELTVEELEAQCEALSPIEDLYSDYIAYNHKLKFKTELDSLLVTNNSITELSSSISKYDKLIYSTKEAENVLNELNSLIEYKSIIDEIKNIECIISELNSTSSYEFDEEFISEICKYSAIMSSYKKCLLVLSTLGDLNENLITNIDEFISLDVILVKIERINEYIGNILNSYNAVDDELKQFNCCPLCGTSLHDCKGC